jgi:hypothetical protein
VDVAAGPVAAVIEGAADRVATEEPEEQISTAASIVSAAGMSSSAPDAVSCTGGSGPLVCGSECAAVVSVDYPVDEDAAVVAARSSGADPEPDAPASGDLACGSAGRSAPGSMAWLSPPERHNKS